MLLWLANLRYLSRHPWQAGLAVLGVMLGVAVVTAVQLTQRSAREALSYTERVLVGAVTHHLVAQHGLLDEQVFADLSLAFPALRALPVLEFDAEVSDAVPHAVRVLGLDLINRSLPTQGPGTPSTLLLPLLRDPATGLVNSKTRRALLSNHGSTVDLKVKGGKTQLNLLAAPEGALAPDLPDDLIVVDIATAQALANQPRKLSAIDLALPATDRDKLVAAIQARLPKGLVLRDSAADRVQQQALTRAFETNLTALSLLVLVVGMFLIYNTESFLIVQRKALFGGLRALGVTRRELLIAVLVEAGLLGVIASIIGVACGVALAHALLQLVTGTINDLYYRVAVTAVSLPPAMMGAIALGGVVATLLAALSPALEATRVPVTDALHARDSSPNAPAARTWPVSVAATLLALLLMRLSSDNLWIDYAALLALMLAVSIQISGVQSIVVAGLLRWLRNHRWWPERIALGNLLRQRRRVGPATTALCVAAAVSVGMHVMISSFRSAVEAWLTQLLRADIYVAYTDHTPREMGESALAELRSKLLAVAEVRAVSSVTRLTTPGVNGPVALIVYDLPAPARAGIQFIAGRASDVWARWETTDIAIITEPFAYHNKLAIGATITLETPRGPRGFTIAGIYRDYANERGAVALSRATYARHWPLTGYSGLGVYARQETGIAKLRAQVETLTSANASLEIHANAELRRNALAVFDRTFVITKTLGFLTLGVSMVGVVSALLAQQLEQARQYGTLRALGINGYELARIVFAQTLVIGVVATVLALPLGIGLGIYLIRVINLHSFGWTMPGNVAWGQLGAIALSLLGAALVAGIYPTLRALHTSPARALRNE